MDTDDLAGRRRQMGEALAGWSAVPGSVHAVGDGSWTYLSGLPSPDLNMALVHGSDPSDLSGVIDRIGSVPALLFCTGDGVGLAENLGAGWSNVGATPFMIAEVADTPQHSDPRVRRATPDDRDAILGLWTGAFGIPPEIFGPLLDATLSDPDGDMVVLVLEHDGEAVTTVTTSSCWRRDHALVHVHARAVRASRFRASVACGHDGSRGVGWGRGRAPWREPGREAAL